MSRSRVISDKGQGLVEAVLTIPIATAIVAVVLVLSYRAVLFYYADFQLHEALICTDDRTTRDCEADLRAQLNQFVRFQEIVKINLTKSGKTARGKIKIVRQLSPNLFFKTWPTLTVEKELSFPLPTK